MAFCQLPVSWEQAVWWTQRPNAWWWLAAAVLWWKRVQREKPSWNCSRNICQKPLACRPTTRLWCAVASQRREASPTHRGQCCRITGSYNLRETSQTILDLCPDSYNTKGMHFNRLKAAAAMRLIIKSASEVLLQGQPDGCIAVIICAGWNIKKEDQM